MRYSDMARCGERLFTREDIKLICKLDNVECSNTNAFQVELLLETWFRLGLDMGFPFWESRIMEVKKVGLKELVSTFDSVFHAVAMGERPAHHVELWTDTINFIDSFGESDIVGVQQASQLLRFGKRFTYDDEKSKDDSFMKFLLTNGSNADPSDKDMWGKLPGTTLIMAVKRYVCEMLGDECFAPFSSYLGLFSHGMAYGDNGRKVKTFEQKFLELYNLGGYNQEFTPHHPAGYVEASMLNGSGGTKVWNVSHLTNTQRNQYLSNYPEYGEMIAVPKNMSSWRLIAPENVRRAWYASRVRKMLEFQITKTKHKQFLAWDDQGQNREKARLGAAQCGYATIDASAASDNQSRVLTFMLSPEWLRPYLYNAISDRVRITMGGKQRVTTLKCFSTSGCQITWLMLGVVMWAIAEYGCSWYGKHAFSYGDDIIVPDEAFQTVVELFEIFGFPINVSKSYHTGFFRESCGGDYYKGYDVSPEYWKRGIVEVKDYAETMQFICLLQHKLYTWRTTRQYLTDVATRLDPQITYSPVGEICDDLWSLDEEPTQSQLHSHRRFEQVYKRPNTISDQVQRYLYYTFLRDGRKYANDEDRLFDISMSYIPDGLFSQPKPCWVSRRDYASERELPQR